MDSGTARPRPAAATGGSGGASAPTSFDVTGAPGGIDPGGIGKSASGPGGPPPAGGRDPSDGGKVGGEPGGADPIVDQEARRREAGADEANPFGRLGRPWNHRSPFRIGFSASLGVGIAYLLYQAVVNARHQLVLVAVAAFLAIGLNPTVSRLERMGLRRGVAVGLVFLATAGFFALFGSALLPPIIEQSTKFANSIPDYLHDLQRNQTINSLDRKYHVVDKITSYLSSSSIGSTAAESVIGVGKALASAFFDGLTVLILTLYFLSSFNNIKRTGYRLMPRSRRARAALLGDEILSRVGGYLAGAFVIAVIAGTTTLIWLSILGVPYALALALVVTVTDVIPLVGATIGAALVTIVAFFVSLPVGIATGIFYLVYQQAENYLIYPRVMKRSVDVNPAAAIVGVLIGGALLGIVGALLAIPLTAALQLILREVVLPRQDSG
ncbi:MAG TPA: AI-2E family transporter [Mycobacteriales bacterium]|nr:AI-2E family transporter [Mycobacteriales bacterium]